MPSPLSGPGLGLPFPQNLYPTIVERPAGFVEQPRSARSGDVFVIPAGDWFINLGLLHHPVPRSVTGIWTAGAGAAWTRGQVCRQG